MFLAAGQDYLIVVTDPERRQLLRAGPLDGNSIRLRWLSFSPATPGGNLWPRSGMKTLSAVYPAGLDPGSNQN